MRSKSRILLLSLALLASTGLISAISPPSVSAKWGLCVIRAWGNYEFYALYPFCFSVEPGTGNAERSFPTATSAANMSSTGALRMVASGLGLEVTCDATTTTAFFNKEGTGYGEIEKLALNNCATPGLPECTMSVTAQAPSYESDLLIRKTGFFVLVHSLELAMSVTGEFCPFEFIEEPISGKLEGVWANIGTEQLVFPETPLEGSSMFVGNEPLEVSGAESFELKEGETVEAVSP